MTRLRRASTRTVIGLGYLAAGVLLSLATAWGTIFYVGIANQSLGTIRYLGAEGADRHWISVIHYLRLGVAIGEHMHPARDPLDSRGPTSELGPGWERVEFLPSWSRGKQAPDGALPVYVHIFETAAGWPVTAWKGEFRATNDYHIPMRTSDGKPWWSLIVPMNYPYMHGKVTVLPVRPIFPAILWSVAIYTGAAVFACRFTRAAFVLLIREPIRWKRRRSGLCAKCGYEIRGVAVCPECGEQARKRRKHQAGGLTEHA
ncbi:MAG: hypothetical protein H6810_01390 [Phycisphaeraceae bacterium]|nr:MAG: hypothetical protein H6810_01390 [Phycisphaeraceae bacterium]